MPLVLFNEVLDHVLRIDRIFRQPQGHVLLIGVSGTGKTTLSRFVAWMNGLSVFQVKVHNKYRAEDFDEDLRGVLRRTGCRVSTTSSLFSTTSSPFSTTSSPFSTIFISLKMIILFESNCCLRLAIPCLIIRVPIDRES